MTTAMMMMDFIRVTRLKVVFRIGLNCKPDESIQNYLKGNRKYTLDRDRRGHMYKQVIIPKVKDLIPKGKGSLYRQLFLKN